VVLVLRGRISFELNSGGLEMVMLVKGWVIILKTEILGALAPFVPKISCGGAKLEL